MVEVKCSAENEVAEGNLGQRLVREFHKAFSLPNPAMSLEESKELWEHLVEEELKELKEAVEATLKEYMDVLYVLNGYQLIGGDIEYVEEVASELTDYINCLNDWDVQEEAFRRVHESNMSKLGDDGKPVYREDGKVLKGPNYKKPDLSDLV